MDGIMDESQDDIVYIFKKELLIFRLGDVQ